MCRNDNNRIREWIEYHNKMNFDAIIIFDNAQNEDEEHIRDIVGEYKNVFVIEFPYKSSSGHWNNIQRMTYHIGCNGIIDNCKYIALIDVDEFIYIPNSGNCIKLFLKMKISH